MSTLNDIVSDVIKREGGSTATNDPSDRGGRTQYGISERVHPEAWTDNKVTEKEAREIFLAKYVVWPGYHRIPASHQKVQAQLIDFGVLSGPNIATQKLQLVLGAKPDGIFGTKTLATLVTRDQREVCNLLAVRRALMIGRLVKKNPTDLVYLNGWLDRVLSFVY